jgi:predicted negative regulator of RcsB-dependent stress response
VDDYMNEKEQWEELKQWLRENGAWIVAGILVGAAALGGWRLWEQRVERLAHEASDSYEQILQAYSRADNARAQTLITQLESAHSGSPYVDQAHLVAARVAAEGNDLERAAKELRGVMDTSRDPELKLVARLRLARVQIAAGKADDALATLGGVPAGTAFAPRVAEIRGDALLAKGDRAGALKAYREAGGARSAGVVDGELLDLKIRDLTTP